MTDRYMHSDQSDIHDTVHKLEKFRSHSGLTVNVVEISDDVDNDVIRCLLREVNGGRDWD